MIPHISPEDLIWYVYATLTNLEKRKCHPSDIRPSTLLCAKGLI